MFFGHHIQPASMHQVVTVRQLPARAMVENTGTDVERDILGILLGSVEGTRMGSRSWALDLVTK